MLTSALAGSVTGSDVAAAATATGPISIGSGLCLDGASGVTVQNCSGSAAQTWQYDSNSGEVKNGGSCLTVTGASKVLGTLAALATCSTGPVQRWVLRPGGQIYNSRSATCLATSDAEPSAGDTVTIATCPINFTNTPVPAAQAWTTSIGAPTGVTITGTTATRWGYGYDTPPMPYVDKDGTFYFQDAFSNYPATGTRNWRFFTGPNVDSVTRASASNATDNADTTTRCNESPTGKIATYNTTPNTNFSQKNYCDLIGVYVDPDTGDWVGLVHNEFTPRPLGDGWHYDSIDYAVSTDQGNTWTIKDHALTSPYSTTRGDTDAFPNDTYSWGDGDQRLLVDTASGYFYVYYFSRVVDQGGHGTGWVREEHVARAPISGKLGSGWKKWYNGAWDSDGVGGQESEIIPTVASGTGYVAPADDYSPSAVGNSTTLTANGVLRESPMQGMDVAWSPYLGAYLGVAGNNYYTTKDLTTQKWTDLGSATGYTNLSGRYQMLIDANRTSNQVLGNTFRVYCNTACPSGSAEYSTTTLTRATAPTLPVGSGGTYRIAAGDGSVLAQTGTAAAPTLGAVSSSGAGSAGNWVFSDNGDGFFAITNAGSGKALGVNSASKAGRAWGATPTLAAPDSADLGQEWAIQADSGGTSYRLINRYSNLVLSVASSLTQQVATSPARSWAPPTGATDPRPVSAQLLGFTQMTAPPASDFVMRVSPTAAMVPVGSSATVSVTTKVTSGSGQNVTLSASGLPTGTTATFSPATVTSGGTSTLTLQTSSTTPVGSLAVTVTGAGALTTHSTQLTLNVIPLTAGTYQIYRSGSTQLIDNPANSQTSGTQLVIYPNHDTTHQQWTATVNTDGSYTFANGGSSLCMDVAGSSQTAGATIDQATCTATTNQRWNVVPSGSGYLITSKSSALSVTATSTANSSGLTQESAGTVWTFTKLG
ncbi:hypothetical protein Lfu02_03160 [Longispora fulva]|nr:hypothetical protein Lfu02_03160 [Longispora fulva]